MGLSNYLPSSRISQSGVCTSTTRPASPFEGQVIYESDTDRVLVWNASAWVAPNSTTANPPGLELVTTCTATFTGGTAGSVSNGVVTIGTSNTEVVVANAFSATYNNYLVVINDIVMTAGGGGMRFVLGATTAVTGYYWGVTLISIPSGAVIGAVGDNATHVLVGTTTSSNAYSNSFDVLNPFIAKRTTIKGFVGYSELGAAGLGNGFHNADTSFTGFILYPATGTLTGGTIRVYGYRN
jgi:hypothetical protein